MPRPKIKLPYSQPEKLLQILSLFAMLGLIVLTVFSMINLPESIPTHFGADGRAGRMGRKRLAAYAANPGSHTLHGPYHPRKISLDL